MIIQIMIIIVLLFDEHAIKIDKCIYTKYMLALTIKYGWSLNVTFKPHRSHVVDHSRVNSPFLKSFLGMCRPPGSCLLRWRRGTSRVSCSASSLGWTSCMFSSPFDCRSSWKARSCDLRTFCSSITSIKDERPHVWFNHLNVWLIKTSP